MTSSLAPDADPRAFLRRLAQEHADRETLRERTRLVKGTRPRAADGSPAATYRGGQVNRLNKAWQPPLRSADRAIAESRLLLPRARDLACNEPYVAAALEEIAKNVVGGGIRSAAAVKSDDRDGFFDEFNAEADALWAEWCERWWDATGELSFDEAQAVALKEVAEAGETFFVEVASSDRRRPIPLSYQTLEPEQLDESRDRVAAPGVNEIRRGIELDPLGRRVAYYFFDRHPDDLGQLGFNSTRVPADRVIHLYRPRRSNQHRGVTWLHTIVQTLRDMGWYLENELQGSAVAALFTVAIKRANGGGSGLGLGDGEASSGDAADDLGNPLEELGPGIIADLSAGDDVQIIDPRRPSNNAGPWIDLLLRMIARGIGLSYLRLTNDYSKANYSSARASDLADRQFFRPLQSWASRRLILPVRRRWTEQMAALGRFRTCRPAEFFRDPWGWSAVKLQPPGWDWVDPTKEVAAALDALDGGLTTLERVLGDKGADWRETLQQIAREREYAKGLGLTVGRPKPTPASSPAGEDEPDEDDETDEPSEEGGDDAQE